MSLHAVSGHYMLNYMSITGIVTCYYMLPWSITWTLQAALIHYMFKFIQWFLVMAAAAADAIALPAQSARCRDRRGGWDSWDKQCLECPWCDSTIFEQSCQIQRYNQLDHQTKSWLMRNRSAWGTLCPLARPPHEAHGGPTQMPPSRWAECGSTGVV